MRPSSSGWANPSAARPTACPRSGEWAHDTGADLAKTNVNGGAIAIGHPLGASGARIMTTLVNALEQRGGRYGLQTMCEGGGMANATIVERLA
jgi:acetyl-CoA acyltransferase